MRAPFQFVSAQDNGIYDAMNKGVKLSKGEWIYFLGADDELFDATILSKIFQLNVSKNISVIAGKVLYDKKDIPFIHSKTKKIKSPSWNFSMWIRNGLHHQGTFYKSTLFVTDLFDTTFLILADYAYNLRLYKNKKNCFKTELLIAKCSGKGISKSGSWKLYKEEYSLKTKESSPLFGIFHYLISVLKFFLRKRINAKE